MSYLVVKDTREKAGHGWTFKKNDHCLGQVVDTLKTGDYSLRGFESVVVVERKGGVAEFVGNLTKKRFQDELGRLESIPYPFVICEFTIEDLINYPVGSGIPPRKWKYLKVKGPAALKLFLDIQMVFKTKFLFCGQEGQTVASSIFKRAMERLDEYEKGFAT